MGILYNISNTYSSNTLCPCLWCRGSATIGEANTLATHGNPRGSYSRRKCTLALRRIGGPRREKAPSPATIGVLSGSTSKGFQPQSSTTIIPSRRHGACSPSAHQHEASSRRQTHFQMGWPIHGTRGLYEQCLLIMRQ